jgi:hypothetical protein
MAVLAGCLTVESQSFRVVNDSSVELAQIATDADFGRYDRLLAKDMGIFFPQGTTVPERDLERIRQIFRDAFLDELYAAGSEELVWSTVIRSGTVENAGEVIEDTAEDVVQRLTRDRLVAR